MYFCNSFLTKEPNFFNTRSLKRSRVTLLVRSLKRSRTFSNQSQISELHPWFDSGPFCIKPKPIRFFYFKFYLPKSQKGGGITKKTHIKKIAYNKISAQRPIFHFKSKSVFITQVLKREAGIISIQITNQKKNI